MTSKLVFPVLTFCLLTFLLPENAKSQSIRQVIADLHRTGGTMVLPDHISWHSVWYAKNMLRHYNSRGGVPPHNPGACVAAYQYARAWIAYQQTGGVVTFASSSNGLGAGIAGPPVASAAVVGAAAFSSAMVPIWIGLNESVLSEIDHHMKNPAVPYSARIKNIQALDELNPLGKIAFGLALVSRDASRNVKNYLSDLGDSIGDFFSSGPSESVNSTKLGLVADAAENFLLYPSPENTIELLMTAQEQSGKLSESAIANAASLSGQERAAAAGILVDELFNHIIGMATSQCPVQG